MQLEDLRRNLILMGGEVERQIQHAIEALTEVDEKKAADVIAADAEIDRMEMVIEEQAVHLLALQQPVTASSSSRSRRTSSGWGTSRRTSPRTPSTWLRPGG